MTPQSFQRRRRSIFIRKDDTTYTHNIFLSKIPTLVPRQQFLNLSTWPQQAPILVEVNYHLSHITNSLQKKIVFQPGSPGDSQRSRRHWLQSNQPLLRMFLSYCSLHGSHGGGLASVRMELILLLQESHQVIKTCASALSQGCKQTQENRQKALPTVLSYRAFS